jgi:hypothetical protein
MMTDDQFFQIEAEVQDKLNELKNACDENGFDFNDRTSDLIVNAQFKGGE